MYKEFIVGQNVSDCCIKCGSNDVSKSTYVDFEYAPFWATYLSAVGAFRSAYRKNVQRAKLRVGFCKKHEPNDKYRDIWVVLSVVVAVALVVYGMKIDKFIYQVLGCISFIVFFFVMKPGNIVKVQYIENGKISIKFPSE